MKKLFVLLMALVMTISLAACGAKETENDGEKSDDNTTSAEGTTEGGESSEDEIVVGFIYVGPIGDGGYTYAHDQGRLYLEEHMPNVKTIYKESVAEDQSVEQEMRNMIDQGATVIVGTSFGYMDYMANIAAENSEVTFLHCSGNKMGDNFTNYFGRIYEARYLSGIVAGMKTETNKIGYVAAYSIPEVVRGINAFTLGAKSVNPDVEVEVVWTSTWYDPAKEKEAAIAVLDNGADVIAQHQDTAGPQQAAEERGAFSIGYNTDMSAMAPSAYMTAPIWNWGPYYVSQVEAVANGTFEAQSYWGGMQDGVVMLAPLTDNAPEGAQEKVDEAAKLIEDGSFHVFQGPITNQAGEVVVPEGSVLTDEEMINLNWFVEGVNGTIE